MGKFWDAFDRFTDKAFGEMPKNEACEFQLKAGGVCGRTEKVHYIESKKKYLCEHNNHHKRG